MSRRDVRMKASDVFRETEFLFAKKVSFDEAFPEIENITVEVEERQSGFPHSASSPSRRIYEKSNFPGEYVNCGNLRCYNGGISVGSIIREMVDKCVTKQEVSRICQGYEGSPKGRRRYRSCLNSFKVKVSIGYREKDSD